MYDIYHHNYIFFPILCIFMSRCDQGPWCGFQQSNTIVPSGALCFKKIFTTERRNLTASISSEKQKRSPSCYKSLPDRPFFCPCSLCPPTMVSLISDNLLRIMCSQNYCLLLPQPWKHPINFLLSHGKMDQDCLFSVA